MNEHKCGGDKRLPLLPDCVIWIEAPIPSRIKLIEPKDIHAKYIALSYPWGTEEPDIYPTKTSTFNARKAGILFIELPPLFQDIVRCARELGIEYLWIDRLCIIQDDKEDWKYQALKMGEVYGNATLTIAVASVTSPKDRILMERDSKWCAHEIKINYNGVGSMSFRFRRRSHPLSKEGKGGDYGVVSRRAWIWQERLLSQRTIFYTPSALKFECHCHSVWEGFGPGVTGRSWSAQLDDISPHSWLTLMEEYTLRDIKHASDRLPAIESVMKRIEENKGWSHNWGVWTWAAWDTNALFDCLTWEPRETLGCHMNEDSYAPTWSWASVEGPISHRSVIDHFGVNDPAEYNLQIQVLGLDLGSRRLPVTGHTAPVELTCRVEEVTDREGKVFRYHYEVPKAHADGAPQPVNPDVALEPWTGTIGEQIESTIRRVPHGENPPEKS
jgi:hypothetical protein